MGDEQFQRGRDFIYREGRLLERRLFAALFENGFPGAVIDCLRGYQNEDGGFGHGLEPDKRAPASQPLDVEFALGVLDSARVVDEAMVRRACDFLVTVADERGAVPVVLPSIEGYPRAAHWAGDFPPAPGPVPAVGIAALLYKVGIEHSWRDRVTDFCWSVIEDAPPNEAHALLECFAFLEHAPDRARAEAAVTRLAAALPRAGYFHPDSDFTAYGLTPLRFAPTPDSPWRKLFSGEQITAHLDRLARDQDEDGGWIPTWQPPSDASRLEWQGIETLRALRILVAYERVRPS